MQQNGAVQMQCGHAQLPGAVVMLTHLNDTTPHTDHTV